jgi:hypothetical protein
MTVGWLVQAGLAVNQPGLHVTGTENVKVLVGPSSHQLEKPVEQRVCGLSKRRFRISLGVLAPVIIGLAVGLGAGLTGGKRHSRKSGQPTAVTYLSKEVRGTDLVLLSLTKGTFSTCTFSTILEI